MFKKLHYVYLAYALPLMLLTARITPPFQVPDEPNHFCRAEQVAGFRWMAVPGVNGKSFLTDRGIEMANSFYLYLPFDPRSRVQEEIVPLSQNIHWNTGLVYEEFPNTAIYPPSGYIGPALGIRIGKWLGLSVINTLYLSRWLNGLFCILLCFYALRSMRAAGLLLFTVLLFPMTVALFGSVSQDGTLIGLACLFASMVYNGENGRGYPPGRRWVMVCCMAAICAAKPPYLPLALVFFFLRLSRKEKVVCFASVFGLMLGWVLLNHRIYGINWAPAYMKIDPSLQLRHVLSHPFRFAGLFFKLNPGVIRDHVYWFIGLLGWEDLVFSLRFYRMALLVLGAALLLSTRFHFREEGRLRLAVLGCLVLAVIAVLTAQYITWMPLDSPFLGGVQSRYFIPLFPFLALVLGGFQERAAGKLRSVVGAGILLFPLVTMVVLMTALIGRYYL